jgi:hypothetical protein
MTGSFDPYRLWLGIRDAQRPPNHYRLLGVEMFEDDPEVIANAADRQMSHVRTFASGPHAAETQQVLNQLSQARVCLLDPRRKAAYDQELQAQFATAAAYSSPPPVPPSPSSSGIRVTPPPPPPPSGSGPLPTQAAPNRALPPRSGTSQQAPPVIEAEVAGPSIFENPLVIVGVIGVVLLIGVGLAMLMLPSGGPSDDPVVEAPPVSIVPGPPNPLPALPPESLPEDDPLPDLTVGLPSTNPLPPVEMPANPELPVAPVEPKPPSMENPPPLEIPETQPSELPSEPGLLRRMTGHEGRVTAIAFDSQGRYAATAGLDGRVRLWSMKGGDPQDLGMHSGGATTLAFSADGSQLVSGGQQGTLQLHTLDPLKLEAETTVPDVSIQAVGLADGSSAVVVCSDRSVRRWTFPGVVTDLPVTLPVFNSNVRLHTTPDGQPLLTAGGPVSQVFITSLAGEPDWDVSPIVAPVTQVAMNQAHLAAGMIDGRLSVRALVSLGSPQVWKAHEGSVSAVALVPQLPMVVSAGGDERVVVWHTETGRPVIEFSDASEPVSSLAVSRDGKLLLAGDADGEVYVWRLPGWEHLTPEITTALPRMASGRAPAPPQADRSNWVKDFQQIWPDAYATRRVPAATQVAADAMVTAAQTETQSARKYFLLYEARRLATDDGNVPLAFEATDRIADNFDADALDLRIETLTALSQNKNLGEQFVILVERFFETINQARSSGRFDRVDRLKTFGASLTSRGRPGLMAVLMQQLVKDVNGWKSLASKRDRLVKQIEDDPTNVEAREELGLTLLAMQGDWQEALPQLATAEDKAIRDLAVADLARPSDYDAMAALAEGYLKLSEDRPEEQADLFARRAVEWIRQAIRKAPFRAGDLNQKLTALQNRLTDESSIGLIGLQPSTSFGAIRQAAVSVSGQGARDCIVMLPLPQGRTHVSYDLYGQFRAFRVVVAIPDTAQPAQAVQFAIRVNGEDVWTSDALGQPGQSIPVELDITDAKTIELVLLGGTDDSGAQAAWIRPTISRTPPLTGTLPVPE